MTTIIKYSNNKHHDKTKAVQIKTRVAITLTVKSTLSVFVKHTKHSINIS